MHESRITDCVVWVDGIRKGKQRFRGMFAGGEAAIKVAGIYSNGANCNVVVRCGTKSDPVTWMIRSHFQLGEHKGPVK